MINNNFRKYLDYELNDRMSNIIDELTEILEQEKLPQLRSHTSQTCTRKVNKILEKVGEEAIETIIAAKDHNQRIDQSGEAVIHETADLGFIQ